LAQKLADMTGMLAEKLRIVEVSKSFDGEFDVDFPDAAPSDHIARDRGVTILQSAEQDIEPATPMKTERRPPGFE
jgi:hypothetical protein